MNWGCPHNAIIVRIWHIWALWIIHQLGQLSARPTTMLIYCCAADSSALTLNNCAFIWFNLWPLANGRRGGKCQGGVGADWVGSAMGRRLWLIARTKDEGRRSQDHAPCGVTQFGLTHSDRGHWVSSSSQARAPPHIKMGLHHASITIIFLLIKIHKNVVYYFHYL